MLPDERHDARQDRTIDDGDLLAVLVAMGGRDVGHVRSREAEAISLWPLTTKKRKWDLESALYMRKAFSPSVTARTTFTRRPWSSCSMTLPEGERNFERETVYLCLSPPGTVESVS